MTISLLFRLPESFCPKNVYSVDSCSIVPSCTPSISFTTRLQPSCRHHLICRVSATFRRLASTKILGIRSRKEEMIVNQQRDEAEWMFEIRNVWLHEASLSCRYVSSPYHGNQRFHIFRAASVQGEIENSLLWITKFKRWWLETLPKLALQSDFIMLMFAFFASGWRARSQSLHYHKGADYFVECFKILFKYIELV